MAVRSPRRLAADQGEARWYDDDCETEKPFVCQAFGVSTPFSLTVSGELQLAGGYVAGAGTVISSTLAQVRATKWLYRASDVTLARGSEMLLSL